MPLSWRQLASLLGPPGIQGPSGLTLTSPGAGDKLPLLYAGSSLTLSEVRALVIGTSPSVTFSLRHGSDFSAAGSAVKTGGMVATNTTTGESWSSLDNPVIPSGSWLWIVVDAVSGTAVRLHISVSFAT
ncbi:MAG: hypothetical protein ACNA8O_12370 [Cyanobacteriota bacterium]